MMSWGWIGTGVLAAGLLGLEGRWWRGRIRFPARRRRHDQLLALVRLLAVCLSAGLPLPAALAHAGAETDEPLRSEVAHLLRSARLSGMARALIAIDGDLAPLARTLARAQVTGAPMLDAVSGFARARQAELRTRHLEQARTLSVALVVPVALLLLPGFLALVVGPAVIDQVSGLLGSVSGP